MAVILRVGECDRTDTDSDGELDASRVGLVLRDCGLMVVDVVTLRCRENDFPLVIESPNVAEFVFRLDSESGSVGDAVGDNEAVGDSDALAVGVGVSVSDGEVVSLFETCGDGEAVLMGVSVEFGVKLPDGLCVREEEFDGVITLVRDAVLLAVFVMLGVLERVADALLRDRSSD